jgi:SAM-dependent methyltransferase/uncharacterized protein YbaR (Trm112 family)
MRRSTIDLLQCPFCGGSFAVADCPGTAADDASITHGVIYCTCNGYPVVDGIAYVREGATAGEAIKLLDVRDHAAARATLLGLSAADAAALSAAPTFCAALAVLGDTPENHYFLYRFSDPRFVSTDGLIRALTGPGTQLPAGGVALDLCGGAGHLTRSFHRTGRFAHTLVADYFFTKLWLAKHFVAPDADAICLDADRGLPFVRGAFDFVLCSGAFEYVWSRRVLADEIKRLLTSRGVAAITHTRNLNCDTFNPGMPLDPAGYRRLVEELPNAFVAESALFQAVIKGQPVPPPGQSDAALEAEPTLALLFAKDIASLAPRPVPPLPRPSSVRLNPLYVRDGLRLTARFPTEDYEAEFGECLAYLPREVTLTPAQGAAIDGGVFDADALGELFARRVVLDLPDRYL